MLVRGFTLLELLAVLLLVGIIAALAVPAYRQHLVRVNRSEAIGTLQAIASAQERFYLRHGRYAGELTAAPPDGLGMPGAVESRNYLFTVALAVDGQTFIASATPTREGGQAMDTKCLVFSLDQRGRRAVSGSGETSSCWR